MTCGRDILRIFPEKMRDKWRKVADLADRLQEIRLRAGRPVLVYIDGEEFYVGCRGELVRERGQAMEVCREELDSILFYVCSSSMYAYEEEISRGYLTLPGGHRMGLVGEAVLEEGGNLRNIKHISGMNLRISHEIKGASDSLLPWLYRDGDFLNTLLISPPCCGKTTMLRDLVRQVSDGNCWGKGRTVAVVDERSEIAGTFQGMAQNDVGMRTDVLDACPKAQGMMLLIRSMSPAVVAVDELGGEDEILALQRVQQCGCKILATMHAGTAQEAVCRLLALHPGGKDGRQAAPERTLSSFSAAESTGFERYVILTRKNGKCLVDCVLDGSFAVLAGEGAC